MKPPDYIRATGGSFGHAHAERHLTRQPVTLYTTSMVEQDSEGRSTRFWDWFAAGLVFLLIQLSAGRLRMTDWVPYLHFAETLGALGTVLGFALGYSRLGRRAALLLAAAYTLAVVPWHLSTAIEVEGSLTEQVGSLLGRLWFSIQQFAARQPVEDALFFAAAMAILHWTVAIYSGYQLTRHANALAVIIPPAVVSLVIQSYDGYVASRAIMLGIFLFISIVLVGRLHFAAGAPDRKNRRVFETAEAPLDIRNQLLLTSALLVVLVWVVPAPIPAFDPAERWWERATEPMRERMGDAVSAIESPYGSGRSGDFFTSTAVLGRNAVQGDEPVFRVRTDASPEEAPPRYYWRAWTYDTYLDGGWTNSATKTRAFDPDSEPLEPPPFRNRVEAVLTFTMRAPWQALLYAAGEPVWVNRPGQSRAALTPDGALDIASWSMDPALVAGDRYQVRVLLADPSMEELLQAGDHYPEWITSRYLQIPSGIDQELRDLAAEVAAGAKTPFEQAAAVTAYLRRSIAYSATLPAPPGNEDPAIWLLFDIRKGFCTYYATAEVLLLRSLGIPSRLAVGFAEGALDDGAYTVLRSDAHAWPEVYFPQIGWVEFEPTVNQASLIRPARSQRDETPASTGAPLPLAPPALQDSDTGAERAEDIFQGAGPLPLGFLATPLGRAVSLGIAILALAVLAWFNRRGRYLDRLPAALARAYTRGEGRAPRWIELWVWWAGLSPIERAFQSVNVSLNLLGQPAPTQASPARRGQLLGQLLPAVSGDIQQVVHAHEAALYSGGRANPAHPRASVIRILAHAAVERLRAGGGRWSRRYNRSDFQ